MFLSLGFKGLNDWWRYVLGVLIIAAFYIAGSIPLTIAQLVSMNQDTSIGNDALKEFERTMDFSIFGIDKNVGFVLLISIFVFALFGLVLVVTYLHKKRMKEMITPLPQINFKKILFGFGLWMSLSLIMEFISYLMTPETYIFRFGASRFIPLLLISLFFLPIQTSFEELFFRSYLMQGMAFFSKNKWLPILLSSILFGFVHGANPEVAKYGFWTMQIYYIIAGLFLAIITVWDDGLELALGVHAATNIFGATLFTYEGCVLQTDSLFKTTEINPSLMTVAFVGASVVFIVICHKVYHWPSWHTLLQPLEDTTSIKNII
jgi:membrane protease YdiL (CAAX protease family)